MSKLAIILLEEIQSAIARSLDRLKSEGFPTDRYEPTVLRDEAELLALIDTIDSQVVAKLTTEMRQAQCTANRSCQSDATRSPSDTPRPAQSAGAAR